MPVPRCVPSIPPADCADTERWDLERGECVRVGRPCPADTFPSDVPDDAVFWLADAPEVDGTRLAPFNRDQVREVTVGAPEGGTLVIGPGAYPVVDLGAYARVRGACAELVQITAVTRISDLEISDLTIAGVGNSVLYAATGATLLAEGVILVGGGLPSVSSDGAEVLVRDARIRGTAGVASATAGAQITFERVDATTDGLGFVALDESRVEVSEAYLHDAGSEDPWAFSHNGATVTFERSFLDLEEPRPFTASDRGSQSIGDVYIRVKGWSAATGMFISDGGQSTLRRFTVEGAADVFAGTLAQSGDTTSLVLEDALILGRGQQSAARSALVEVNSGTANLARVRFESHAGLGVVGLAEAELQLLDMDLEGSEGGSRAVQVQGAASAVIERGRFRGATGGGVVAVGAGTTIDARDLRVERVGEAECVSEEPCGRGGIALASYFDAEVSVERFWLAENALAGIQLGTGGVVLLSDGTVAANPVGVSVIDSNVDLASALDRVVFIDNGMNLDFTERPPPDLRLPGG